MPLCQGQGACLQVHRWFTCCLSWPKKAGWLWCTGKTERKQKAKGKSSVGPPLATSSGKLLQSTTSAAFLSSTKRTIHLLQNRTVLFVDNRNIMVRLSNGNDWFPPEKILKSCKVETITGTIDIFPDFGWTVQVESYYSNPFPSLIDYNKLYVTKWWLTLYRLIVIIYLFFLLI